MATDETGDATRPDMTAHGHPSQVPIDALLSDDPDLWLVTADVRAWSDAHACECEALCECDEAA
jgi:hypothetical protein